MSSVPLDMMMDIFCRCDVDDLGRFRCLSKECCCLIDSPDFISLHLSQSLKMKPTRQMVVGIEGKSKSLRCISATSPAFTFAPFHEYSELYKTRIDYKIPFPNPKIFQRAMILGSCNGLVAILILRAKPNKLLKICLLNPSTRVYRYLPMQVPSIFFKTHGFGYDPVSDDYKLVEVSVSETQVYSLNSDSWKCVDAEVPFPLQHCLVKRRPCGVLVNNALHWLLGSVFVAFDVTREKYRRFSIPDVMLLGYNPTDQVYELGGCLCVSLVKENQTNNTIDIWVMQEYGLSESWNKIITLNDGQIQIALYSDYKFVDWWVYLADAKCRRVGLLPASETCACLVTLVSPYQTSAASRLMHVKRLPTKIKGGLSGLYTKMQTWWIHLIMLFLCILLFLAFGY